VWRAWGRRWETRRRAQTVLCGKRWAVNGKPGRGGLARTLGSDPQTSPIRTPPSNDRTEGSGRQGFVRRRRTPVPEDAGSRAGSPLRRRRSRSRGHRQYRPGPFAHWWESGEHRMARSRGPPARGPCESSSSACPSFRGKSDAGVAKPHSHFMVDGIATVHPWRARCVPNADTHINHCGTT